MLMAPARPYKGRGAPDQQHDLARGRRGVPFIRDIPDSAAVGLFPCRCPGGFEVFGHRFHGLVPARCQGLWAQRLKHAGQYLFNCIVLHGLSKRLITRSRVARV